MGTLKGSTMLLLAAVACGGGDETGNDGNNNGNNGSMSASIDGSSWTGNLATAANYQGNVLGFAGTNGTYQLTFALTGVTGTGTITLGTGHTSIATVSTVSTTPQTWSASFTGGTGTVVITTLNSTEVAGTFSFTAMAAGGGATGTKSVTSGQFSVKF